MTWVRKRKRHIRRNRVPQYVGRAILSGMDPADVAARYGLTVPEVLEMATRRQIRAQTASEVKRRHAAGASAEAIAEDLHLDLVNVRAFLDRAFPAPKPPRAPRPPKPGSKSDPERWRYSDRPDPELLRRPAVTELLAADVGQGDVGDVGQAERAEPLPPAISDPAGEWDHFQETFKGRPKLTWESAESIRRDRAAGMTRAVLARRWGVSLGTIDSIIARRTYREPPPSEVMPATIAEAMPATSPGPGPKPHRWRTPKGPRGQAWHDD